MESQDVCEDQEDDGGTMMPTEILFYSRRKDYAFLSNFYPSPIMIDGLHWPTVEHYYQAKKTLDPAIRERIRVASTPAEAKRLGRNFKPRKDWENIKIKIMKKALWIKFTQNINLGVMLLGTGEAVLHEDSPHDRVWGIHGQDLLGKLLMEVRTGMRKGLGSIL